MTTLKLSGRAACAAYWRRDRSKDQTMTPQQAPLFPDGLEDHDPTIHTAWRLTAWVKPPCSGWWKTRSASSPLINQPQRRWWNGTTFSMPVIVGKDPSSLMMEKRYMVSLLDSDHIEWCGLIKSPGGYLPENGYKRQPCGEF